MLTLHPTMTLSSCFLEEPLPLVGFCKGLSSFELDAAVQINPIVRKHVYSDGPGVLLVSAVSVGILRPGDLCASMVILSRRLESI